VRGPYNPFIVGAGLFVSQEGTLSSTGGGGGGVSSILAGNGISVSSATGNVTVSNIGVNAITAGSGISLSGTPQNVIINSLATGTVTSIFTGTGLQGGPISISGTISLANTTVTAGTYTNATVTVNAQGQITNAANGTVVGSVTGVPPINVTAGTTPVVSINAASTTGPGAVQLSDAVNSNSSAFAATSLAVKTAYDIAIQAIPKSCVTGQGALITGTAASTPVALPLGTDGYVLTACTACATGLYWASVPTPPVVAPNYGSFLGATSQTITTAGTPQPVEVPTTVAANNFSIVNNSEITAAVAGTYNLQFSIQLLANPGGGGDVEIWLAKNGSAVPETNTRFHIKNTNEAEFAALNYVESLAAGDFLQLFWSTGDADNFLYGEVGPTALGGPGIPAAIITIVPVGA
jgi:hypothetical protein